MATANFSGPPPGRIASLLLGLGSASQTASVKVSVTESREVLASVGLMPQQIYRWNFDYLNDPPNLICLNLCYRVAASRLAAALGRHRCAPRRDRLMSNYLTANRAW